MTTNNDTSTGSATVAAIENAWTAIAERHPDLPRRIVVITGSGARSGSLVRGHWKTYGWTNGEDVVPELFLSGERIADGPAAVLTTLLHEAAHALAMVRGIKDTSRQGRYHNGEFAKLAIEVGLEPPAQPDKVLGLSDCTLMDVTAADYVGTIAELWAALGASIPTVTTETLMAWLNICALFVGGCVGGWIGFGSWGVEAGFPTLTGVRVLPPKAPRRRRQVPVTFACGCREITVPAAEAEQLVDIECGRCGKPFEA